MHIAVIGGGLMGMTLAYFLSEAGQRVTVLEQGSAIGGLHNPTQLADNLSIPRYPHNIHPGDKHIFKLINQLGLQDEVCRRHAPSGLVHHGDIYPLRSIWDFLTFRPLRLRDRLRLGQTILQARLTNDWHTLDQIPVRDWLIKIGGKSNFERVWAPLLEAKFDYDYDDVPATFIWSWLNRASTLRGGPDLHTSLVYLRRGPGALVEAMADAIRARGNEIRVQTRVREIEIHDNQIGQLRTYSGILDFDMVAAAIPTPELSHLLLTADETYRQSLSKAPYLGLICPALVVDQPASEYWTLNLTDPSSPFSSIVTLPHPDNAQYHVMYLPKYTAPENDWMGVPDSDILEAWMIRLRQVYPNLKPEHIKHAVVNRTRYVDPLHALNAKERIPAVQTPYEGLYLANTSQVYPELPTSEAVIAHAQRVARQLLAQPVRHTLSSTAA